MFNFPYNDNEWIELEEYFDNGEYSIYKLKEKENSRENIYSSLIKTVICYYIHPETIKYFLDKDDYFHNLEQIIYNHIPDIHHDRIRKGDFGEIIASEHLKQKYGYYIPYIKLREKHQKNSSVWGDDILAFKFDEDDLLESLCIGESKVQNEFKNSIFKIAHNQLKESIRVKPKSLNLVVNKLAQEKNKYYPQIVRILNNEELSKIKFDSWIFVISGTPTRNISINEEELIENLSIVSFYLPNLEEFINEIYDGTGRYYEK